MQDVVLYDQDGNGNTTGDQVKADGSIRLETSYIFDMVVKNRRIESFTFIRNNEETADLKVDSSLEINVSAVKQIARHTFTPIYLQVGGFPIIFTPVLEINVGIDGRVEVNMSTDVTQQANLQVGIQYENNKWNPISELTTSFGYGEPTLNANVNVRGYAEAQISLLLYGIVGPYAGIEAYLELDANINSDPWWTLYGGVDVPIGVKVEILGISIVNYEIVPIAYRVILAQASSDQNQPPNAPSNPLPANGATNQSVNVNLDWIGSDPNGDDLTYDVYFEANDSSPDILVCNDQTTSFCDIGLLSNNTRYYWQVIAKDEHGATKAGSVWTFITENVPQVETLNFRVRFEGRDNSDNQLQNVPLRIQIKDLLCGELLYSSNWKNVVPASGSNNWGTATLDVSSASLTSGHDYKVLITGAMHLTELLSITLTDGMTVDLLDPSINPDGILVAGDINQDNQITTADLEIIAENFGTNVPSPPNPNAEAYRSDINGDGIISLFDLTTTSMNVGEVGGHCP